MATNGRCIAFLENLMTDGVPGSTIDVRITEVSLIITCPVDFMLHCYEEFSSKPITDVRSICHKLPMELDDPVFKGFRHKSRGAEHHIAVILAPEIFESRNIRDLRQRNDMHILIWHLRQLFAAFQPLSDRTRLQGKCRKKSDYDRPRLMLVANFFGLTWGFPAQDLIEQYRDRPVPVKRKRPRDESSQTIARAEKACARSKPVPFFGVKMPRYRGDVSVFQKGRRRTEHRAILPASQAGHAESNDPEDASRFAANSIPQRDALIEEPALAEDFLDLDPFFNMPTVHFEPFLDDEESLLRRSQGLDPYAFTAEFEVQ